MRVNNDHLTKEAELGKLPFDVFALVRHLLFLLESGLSADVL